MASTIRGTLAPEDTAFKQQRLKAWQPILTPVWVILTFTVIGIVFVPIGIVLKGQSNQVYEEIIYYDSPNPNVNCSINTINQGFISIQNGAPMNCSLTFQVTRDIPLTSTLYVYYQLTNFYQNHRRYVQSVSDSQIGGSFVSDSLLSTSCDPNGSFVSSQTGLIFAPCGLIATSFFNDAFFLNAYNNGNPQTAAVAMNTTGIAWSSDLSAKFKNPTNPPGSTLENQPLNNWLKYQYLWQTYDQMSCYDNTSGARVACQTWAEVTKIPGVFGNGCAKCKPSSTARYEGGIPPPGGPDVFNATPGAPGSATAPYGFRDEHFVVWMRTAGLPTFRKLYGTVSPPVGGFIKGDTLTFNVVPNFEVQSFASTKALILSTTTPTGGRSDVLGIAYLIVGSLCLALAVSFGIRHLVAPRTLGDPKYILKHAKQ